MTMQSNLAIAAPLTPSAGTSGARERVRSGSATTPASGTAPRSRPDRRHHIHNPWIDFLTLGGGSLIVLGAMAAFYPRDEAARVALAGAMLGTAGFWWTPNAIDAPGGYERAVFGTTLLLCIGWTFINIHHYFMDSVIGRGDNPETRRYLYSLSGRPATPSRATGRPDPHRRWHRRLTS